MFDSNRTSKSLSSTLLTIFMQTAALFLVVILVLLLLRIAFRHQGIQIRGLEFLSQLLMVWMGFLIVGNLELQGRHIDVDLIEEFLGPRPERLTYAGVLVVNLFTTVVIVYSTLLAVQSSMGRAIPSLGVPTSLLYAAPFSGMVILTIVYGLELREAIDTLRTPAADTEDP